MKRKEKKYEVVAAVATAGREQGTIVGSRLPGERDAPCGALPMIEVSDADYRSLYLPCDALEESTRHIKKGSRKPGD